MADQNLVKQKKKTSSEILHAHLPEVIRLTLIFVPDFQKATLLVRSVFKDGMLKIQKTHFEQFARLLLLNCLVDQLKKLSLQKGNTGFTMPFLGSSKEEYGQIAFEDLFLLILRDKQNISCVELASIFNTSEGAIRTRLQIIRGHLLKERLVESSTKLHPCVFNETELEESLFDFEGSDSALKEKLANECKRCAQFARHKTMSMQLVKNIDLPQLSEEQERLQITDRATPITKMLFNWSNAPWYLKAVFEGMLAVTLVLGIVLSMPRLKSLYEYWLERRFDLYSLAEITTGSMSTSTPEPVAETQNIPLPPGPIAQNEEEDDEAEIKPESEFLGRESQRVSSDKVYRIFIKTEAPEELRNDVLAALQNIEHTSAAKDGVVGGELPGGYLFDLFIPFAEYKNLVSKIADVGKRGDMKFLITRNRERAQHGKARIKIWLQRI
ncbi:MAG: hypothetical protein AB7F43_14360 [Bacteriovoracia bacterium]